jgi:TrmH family RNA methyltransferase
MVVSKNRIKFLRSLHVRKYRQKYGQFLVEGFKSIKEVLESDYQIEQVFYAEGAAFEALISSYNSVQIGVQEMKQISYFNTPADCIALVNIPQNTPSFKKGNWRLLLDELQDPGNLGTIIRTADWFDIPEIYVSTNTVDLYNPKTVSSTMGSFARVNIKLLDQWHDAKALGPIYASTMDGDPLEDIKEQLEPGTLIIGNEGHGIRKEWIDKADKCLSIKRFGKTESLNAAIATSIFCHQLKNYHAS